MQPDKPSSSVVKTYYDGFLESRMRNYRIHGNLRLDLAKELLLSVVRPTDAVADIGCGIGILAEAIAKANPRARVVGIDISPANIEYARKTVRRRNVQFYQADITEQFSRLHEFSPTGYDILALVDVIEHIPEAERPKLFSDLEGIAKPNALLAITYPSPEYQRHLMAEKPEELRIIDNVIEIESLCREAAQSGWTLRLFKTVDVWLRGQYVHCIFGRCTETISLEPIKINRWFRMISMASRFLLRPYRLWYYRYQASRN